MALPPKQLPVTRRGWFRVVLFCIAYLTMLVIIALAAGTALGIKLITSGNTGQAVNTENLTILILFLDSVLAIALVYVFRRYIDRRSFSSIGFSWHPFRQDAWVGFLLAPAILGLGSMILFFNQNLQWTDIVFNTGDFFIALILTLAIALGEEITFRGYLLNNLLESFNKWTALGISALIFTAAHAANPNINFVAIINLLMGGVLLGFNYIYTRNLWFSVFFHFSWNFFQGPVLGYEVSGIGLQSLLEQQLTGSALLTGNSFGFEGSLLSILLILPALFVLFFVYEKRYAGTISTTP